MEHLDVTPSRLQAASAGVRDAAAAIDRHLETLTAAAAALREEWSGEAQQAFDVAQRRFVAGMSARADLVRLICRALEDLAGGYSRVDLEAGRALGNDA